MCVGACGVMSRKARMRSSLMFFCFGVCACFGVFVGVCGPVGRMDGCGWLVNWVSYVGGWVVNWMDGWMDRNAAGSRAWIYFLKKCARSVGHTKFKNKERIEIRQNACTYSHVVCVPQNTERIEISTACTSIHIHKGCAAHARTHSLVHDCTCIHIQGWCRARTHSLVHDVRGHLLLHDLVEDGGGGEILLYYYTQRNMWVVTR